MAGTRSPWEVVMLWSSGALSVDGTQLGILEGSSRCHVLGTKSCHPSGQMLQKHPQSQALGL